MSKVKIEVILKTNDCNSMEEYNALLNNNKLIYQEKEFKTTLTIDKKFTMKRESAEYLFYLEFEANKCTNGYCMIKNYNKRINLDILTDYIIIEKELLILKYKIITTEQEVIHRLNLLKK